MQTLAPTPAQLPTAQHTPEPGVELSPGAQDTHADEFKLGAKVFGAHSVQATAPGALEKEPMAQGVGRFLVQEKPTGQGRGGVIIRTRGVVAVLSPTKTLAAVSTAMPEGVKLVGAPSEEVPKSFETTVETVMVAVEMARTAPLPASLMYRVLRPSPVINVGDEKAAFVPTPSIVPGAPVPAYVLTPHVVHQACPDWWLTPT